MSARILGSIDIIGGFLIILSRGHYPTFSSFFLAIGIVLLLKGLYSMI